jgi:hypothetical protein
MWTKAAGQGNAEAQFGLGAMYHNGQGVTQNYNQAVLWYRKAANQGNAEAQFNLGLVYAKGQGVEEDANQSLLWFRKAADKGRAEAQFALGLAYQNGQGVMQDYNQAVLWYRKAAVKGNWLAQFNLGSMYQNGRGVTQDNVEALKWFVLAAAYDTDEESRRNTIMMRGMVANDLTDAQIAEVEKRATVDPMFHSIVADIIRRVIEWRKETRAVFDKLAARPKEIAHDLKPEEMEKLHSDFRRGVALYGLSIKYAETMGRLSRFFNENVEKENYNLPKVEWWQKLNKLFEIEESFYKQVREAVAANNWEDYGIYSGLAKESLQQIWDSIEKVDNSAKPVTEKKKLPDLPEVEGLCAKQNISFVMGHALYTWWQQLKKTFDR